MIVIQLNEINKYQLKTLDPSFKGVVFNYETPVLYENFVNRKNFSFIICKERFVKNQLVFYLQRNHFLVEKFSEKIELFREFGIMNFIISKYVDSNFRGSREEDEREALKFRELSATFGLWIGGLAAGFIVFIIEILYNFKIRKKCVENL